MSEAESNHRLKIYGIVAAIVALIVVAWGITSRSRNERELTQAANASTTAPVTIVHPVKASGGEGLALPGNVQAFNSAPIFARTNGYVRRWLVDIGDRVRSGQVMAVLETPEVDQQLAQARAQYETALANQRLAKSTAVRWQTLLAKDAVSRQEADEKNGDLAAKIAVTNAAAADVKRIQALNGFGQLTAPFAGDVTSRAAQIGQLVTAGSGASPLFTVSDVHRMRVYVRVPQAFVAQMRPGLDAQLTVPEYPDRTFKVTISRTSGAVDPQSGSMLVELQADNKDRALKPGAYAQVHFPAAAAASGFRLPGSAILFNDAGNQVAVVDASGHVSMRKVNVTSDEGKSVVISGGLNGTERVIDSPSDAIAPGDKVQAVEAPPAKPASKA
ncbi:efflux RND transporter periplasmic adaptor subunit [Sphingomonas nostoxanthinifaciens]|uniref:efflux RND transporter periplasmic adaptor subunit n=1 Tax=Sphingomonas nostoxanthinifaciens TaxID=2872652 RepID=UPI001CC1D814|nr:efflux RND transporter periplasmic adaptor subunit [Sphingomonas nostoxanthinifaciens]UAK24758.1 efflux RND transporter periplasmic adaptor subunit [Sphingomonas nostoxanthinifaciens]